MTALDLSFINCLPSPYIVSYKSEDVEDFFSFLLPWLSASLVSGSLATSAGKGKIFSD